MKPSGKRLGPLADLPVLILSLLVVFVYTSSAVAQAPGTFIPTGNMTTPRESHTATLLLNGKVLITGGSQELPASAELFDPVTNTFTPTGNMTTGRFGNSATLLPDGGVLIAGGYYFGYLDSAELYDPATGTFTATGHMVTTQNWHTATLLNNGKVLIAGGGRECPGGADGCLIADRPELYDPATGTFTIAGDYADRSGDPWFGTNGLVGAPLTLLPNDNVLIAAEPTAEIYDPSTKTFRLTGQMTRGTEDGQQTPAIFGTQTLLTNGRVLLTGGEEFEWTWLNDAELYDPSTGKFTASHKMTRIRSGQTATLLRDGMVLIAGGDHSCNYWNSGGVDVSRCDAEDVGTEIYDPVTDIFNAGANLTTYRINHTATLLMDGRVLVVGGGTDMRGFWPTNSAEIYTPSLLAPAQIVTNLRFDRTNAATGGSYSVNISGSNLTPETFFDIRFIGPGHTDSDVVLNWQRELAASHGVPAGTATGSWTINGVRAHQIETDHTGNFAPVSATITVSP